MFQTVKPAKSKYFVLTKEIVIPAIIILIVIGGVVVSLKTDIFAVRTITCTLDFKECTDAGVIAELNKLQGQNLLTIQTGGMSGRLTAGNFMIRQVEFHKQLPNTLRVELLSVYPVAAIQVKNTGSEWIVVDGKYRVIGIRNTDPNVPVVIVDSPPDVRIGTAIADQGVVKALDFAISIVGELPSVRATELSGDTITLELAGGKSAILSTSVDRDTQIHTLQAVLADSTMIKEVRSIDVRFGRPVLK